VLALDFLEDIHVFAMANMLRRTIIILAPDLYSDYGVQHLRGIYLPLLIDPDSGVNLEPIVLAYAHSHFMPLMLAMTASDIEQRRFKASAGLIRFTGEPDRFETGQWVRNAMPLHHADLTMMDIQFLSYHETGQNLTLLKRYMSVKEFSVDLNDDLAACLTANSNKLIELAEFDVDTEKWSISLTCCNLVTERSLMRQKSGISAYLDFLDQTMDRFDFSFVRRAAESVAQSVDKLAEDKATQVDAQVAENGLSGVSDSICPRCPKRNDDNEPRTHWVRKGYCKWDLVPAFVCNECRRIKA
jgi:hypothetical protein